MATTKALWRTRATAYTFLLPNIVGFFTFVVAPVAFSLAMSFTNWDGFNPAEFVFLDNYAKMFGDESFRISLVNTLIFTFFSVPVAIAISTLLAVLVNVGYRAIKVFRLFIFLPYVSSTIAIAVVWNLLFHPDFGPVNHVLQSLGVQNPPGWFSSTQWALPGVILVDVWKQLGFFMVILLAALQGIPKSLYECAEIDGAGVVRRFFSITVPMLTPALFFCTVIGVINSFKVFDLIYALTEGGPGRATNVLSYTIYQQAFLRYQMGYASAIAVFLFLLIMIFTLFQFRGQNKWVQYT